MGNNNKFCFSNFYEFIQEITKRVTFASSKGASTSSRTHIGEGLVKKTAKIKDKAVSACSPPERRVID